MKSITTHVVFVRFAFPVSLGGVPHVTLAKP